jgi:hypothetical protein
MVTCRGKKEKEVGGKKKPVAGKNTINVKAAEEEAERLEWELKRVQG